MNAMLNTSPLLRLRNIRKTFPTGRCLLDIAELSIYAGRCLLLTGPNGVGKTTLLKIVAGLEPPDRALVDCNGCPILPWHAALRRYRQSVIYLHQHAYLFDASVANNVSYGLRRLGASRLRNAERVRQALELTGLSHLAARNARELSGGEKQRVALTRALVLSPKVLLLDEPFAGLDDESRDRTGLLIQRLKSEQVGVVVTSHELLPLTGIVDDHFELRAGQLAAPTKPMPRAARGGRRRAKLPHHQSTYEQLRMGDETS